MSFRNAKIVQVGANPADYFLNGERGTKKFAVSSGSLRNFAHCPSRFLAGYESPQSDAKDYGSLLDCRVLTPLQFESRYIIQPKEYQPEKGPSKKWNNNAAVCQAWRDKALADGKEIVTEKDLESVIQAETKLMSDPIIYDWFKACNRQVWVAGEWIDEEVEITVPVHCLIDFAPRTDTEFAKCLGDLKTTRNAGLMSFQRFSYQMGYHWQGAFDLDLYCAATEQDRNTWCWILQENFAPWQTAKRIMSQDLLAIGRAEYRQALTNYCHCLKSGHWPDYDDTDEAVQGWGVVAAEPWMANAAQFAPKFNFAEEASEATESDDVIP